MADRPGEEVGFLSHLDKRRRDVKRLRQRYAEFRKQLGRSPSPSDETLLRQAATLSVRMEDLAADLATGKNDDDALIRTGGTLNRTLYRLGLVSPPAPALSHAPRWGRERRDAIMKKAHDPGTPEAEMANG